MEITHLSERATAQATCTPGVRPILLAHLSQRLTGELKVYHALASVVVVVVVVHHFKTSSPLNPRLANQSQILCGVFLGRGKEVNINGPGQMTKMAAMPIYGTNLKYLLLKNQKSYDLETWHVASESQLLQS